MLGGPTALASFLPGRTDPAAVASGPDLGQGPGQVLLRCIQASEMDMPFQGTGKAGELSCPGDSGTIAGHWALAGTGQEPCPALQLWSPTEPREEVRLPAPKPHNGPLKLG